MTSSYSMRCNSLNAESDFSNGLATEGRHVGGGDSAGSSVSTLSVGPPPAGCPGLGRCQQRPEAGVCGGPGSLRSWRVSIDDLPDELLISIFSHMSFSELVDVVQKVCTRWKSLAQDADLWADKEYLITCLPHPHLAYLKAGKTDQEAVQTLAACPQLRRVCLWRGAKCRVFRALYKRCRKLSALYLHPTQKLSYQVLKNLVEKCSRIHTLRISNELLKSEQFAAAVSQLEQLRVLELVQHFLKNPPVLRPLGDGCPQLAEVRFGLSNVDMDDLRHFLNAKRNTLKSISIKWTMEGRRSVLPLLSVCAGSLEQLELCEYDLLQEGAVPAFTALASLHSLRELKMAVTSPPPPGAAALAFQSGGLWNLEVLQLQHSVGLDDAAVVAACRGCPGLRELSVRRAQRLTDAAFSQVHRLRHLEVLDVSGCSGLGGALLPRLATLPRLHSLWMEDLDCARLRPGLTSILQLRAVRCLVLNHSVLTGVPFQEFPDKLTSLRELHVCWCQGDSEALGLLAEQMPGLTVHLTMCQHRAPDDAEVNYMHIEYEADASDEEEDSDEEEGSDEDEDSDEEEESDQEVESDQEEESDEEEDSDGTLGDISGSEEDSFG